MSVAQPIAAIEQLETLILTLRGDKVILAADLARVYGVTTKALNQAIKRNQDRFPADFVFPLIAREKAKVVTDCDHLRQLRFSPVLPLAFTEHGAIMAATVLNSPRAVAMSVYVVRAFVRMRRALAGSQSLEKRLAEIERSLLGHDAALRDLYQKLRPLLLPPAEPARKTIGFQVKERRARYAASRPNHAT